MANLSPKDFSQKDDTQAGSELESFIRAHEKVLHRVESFNVRTLTLLDRLGGVVQETDEPEEGIEKPPVSAVGLLGIGLHNLSRLQSELDILHKTVEKLEHYI